MTQDFRFASASDLHELAIKVHHLDFDAEPDSYEAEMLARRIGRWRQEVDWLKSGNRFLVAFACHVYGMDACHPPARQEAVRHAVAGVLHEVGVAPFPGAFRHSVEQACDTAGDTKERKELIDALSLIAPVYGQNFHKEALPQVIQACADNTDDPTHTDLAGLARAVEALDARDQLAYIVRYDVTYMAAGVKNFFLYGIHSDPAMGQTSCRAIEHDRAIKPVLAARAILAWLVDGVGRPVRSEPVKGVDAYEFPSEHGRTVRVMWSYDGQPHRTTVPRGAEVLDVLGNQVRPIRGEIEVTHEPVYVRGRE